jgi:glycine cleavage system aminomethyltransferase T
MVMAAKRCCWTAQRRRLDRSVAYGHSVGKILAFAYVKPEAANPEPNWKSSS